MGCVANVTWAIKGIDGVAQVDVNLPRGRACIGFDLAHQPGCSAAAITAAGYPAARRAWRRSRFTAGR